MADPVKTLRSLEILNSDYAVFERDQVLTEAQLNSVAAYFDDQERLTRIHLLGVGVVGGLQVAISAGKVAVGKGVGLTTDGDLFVLGTDTLFDGVKPYDESAPVYDPFYVGSDPKTMLKLWELVKEGDTDPRKQPFGTLPAALNSFVVVAYMECFQEDHDLCTAADCDNLGIVAKHTQRVLLISRADAAALDRSLSRVSAIALEVPYLKGSRPKINSSLDTVAKLAALYREACQTAHLEIRNSLGSLATLLPAFVQETFGSTPIAAWIKRLDDHATTFSTRSLGIQYYHAFLCDIVEAWNALRDALLDDDSVLCPDLLAFPKHLLLGDLNAPLALRTSLYPALLSHDARDARRHATALALRVQTLILAATFEPPPVVVTSIVTVPGEVAGTVETRKVLGSLRVSPSRDSLHPLEERAIPVYYGQDPANPVLAAWNPKLNSRRGKERNTGYRWAEYTGKAAPDFFATPISSYNFFRIEGHLGQHVHDVTYTLEQLLRTHNVPMQIRSVLVHSDRKRVIKRPPRYSDLHRLHYLLRKDVQSELSFSRDYNASFYTRIGKVVDTGPGTVADVQRKKIDKAIDTASPTLATPRYSAYRKSMSSESGNWLNSYQSVIEGASTVKKTFGDRVRTDYISPFDTVIANNHGIWVQWLDLLLDKKAERADEKLLLSTFFGDHSGVEHAGGVAKGGTFVLAYDDLGIVVADLSLPYAIVETGETEIDEPDLPVPPHRLPEILDIGFEVVEPIEIRFIKEFREFEDRIRPQWQQEITIQTNYEKFFKESLGTLGDVLNKFGGNKATFDQGGLVTGDAFLDTLLNDARGQTEQIDNLRKQLSKSDLPREAEQNILKLLERKESTLGNLVKETTRYLVDSKTNVAVGQPAAAAVEVLGGALVAVKDQNTLSDVQAGFRELSEAGLELPQSNLVKGIANAGGMTFRK